MTDSLLNGGIGSDGFQTAKVAAVAALTQRVNLNVANLAHVTVTANKNAAIRDNTGARTAVNAHQN